MNIIRGAVSKKKKRYIQDGFDLDLAYVTPQIIAMGFPSTGTEAAYRNPMPEVQRFFRERHPGHNKIYNLCSERGYGLAGAFDSVECFPFDDHNPCAFDLIEKFCESVEDFLGQHPENVVGVHCKAGKGRTGMLICCYLIYQGIARSADEAMRIFARERTHNGKGVTIPSQKRYVHYYGVHRNGMGSPSSILRMPPPPQLCLRHIRFVTIPAMGSAGCDPYVVVKTLVPPLADINDGNEHRWRSIVVYNQLDQVRQAKNYWPTDRFAELVMTADSVFISGDVLLTFYAEGGKMFHLWFNTRFVKRNFLVFEKPHLDGCHKDKKHVKFSEHFKVELYMCPAERLAANETELRVGKAKLAARPGAGTPGSRPATPVGDRFYSVSDDEDEDAFEDELDR